MRTATWLLAGLIVSIAVAQAPKKVALLVGIGQYDKPGFEALPGAENDANALGAELRKLGFESTVLTGRAATLENLRATVKAAAKPLTQRDLLLVNLNGHGQRLVVKDGEQTREADYFCPVDGVSRDPETLLPLAEVMDAIAGNAGRGLVLIDACRDTPDDPGRAVSNRRVAVSRGGLAGKAISVPSGMAVLFSCAEKQRSWEHGPSKHGLFTFCFLEELRAATGDIVWLELTSKVQGRMESPEIAALLPDGQHQTPVLASNVGRVSLGRRAEKPFGRSSATMNEKLADKIAGGLFDKAAPNAANKGMTKSPLGDFRKVKQKIEGAKSVEIAVGDEFEVVKAIAPGVLTAADGFTILDAAYFPKGAVVGVIETHPERIKIKDKNGLCEGWLGRTQVAEYLGKPDALK